MARKTALTDSVKKFKKLVVAGNIAEAKKFFPMVEQAIDKAAKTNLIKDNNAGRKKSRLFAFMNKPVTAKK